MAPMEPNENEEVYVTCSICQEDTILDEITMIPFEEEKNCEVVMCIGCENEYNAIKKNSSPNRYLSSYQICLYLALKHLLKLKDDDIYLEWEDKDSSGKVLKTVDIAILSAKLYIEVNGIQHVESCEQLRSDLWRSYYSFNAGFLTLPVFNKTIKSIGEFYQIVDIIVRIVNASSASNDSKVQKGYCIRTGVEIDFDVNKPFCRNAFAEWNNDKDWNFPEKFCHFSGEPSDGETSRSKPILAKNYKDNAVYILLILLLANATTTNCPMQLMHQREQLQL
jgi:hypothetical protein